MSTGTAFVASSFQPRSRSLAFAGTFVLLAGVSALVALIPHMEYVAISAIYIGAFLAYMGLRSDSQGGYLFEVIVLFSVLSFLQLCVGTIYYVIVPEALRSPALAPFLLSALALGTLGYLCLLVGYRGFFRTTAPSPLGRFVPKSIFIYIVPAAMGALGISVQRFQDASNWNSENISASVSFLQQFGAMFYFGWFLAWYMIWAGRLRGSTAVFVMGTISIMASVVLYVTFGGKALAVTVLGMPAMAYYEVKRKLPVKTIVVVALLFVFIIFPVYNTFRHLDRSLDMTLRVDRTVEMARGWNSDTYLDASLFAFIQRISIATSIAAIVSDTGRWVDYRYGETLVLAPIGVLIPRFIWPEKPNISIGREFGSTFRLTNSLDRETYVALSMVGEFYWNFSVPGVVAGMWLIGLGYRWYYQRYGAGTGFDPIRKSIYFTLLPNALASEGNVAMLLVGCIKPLVILVIFLFFAERLGWLEDSSAR